MRRRRKRVCLFLLLVLVGILVFHTFQREVKSMYKALRCDEARGRQLLSTMCMFYRNGRTVGNLCEDLCNTGLLEIGECLSHKNDNVIFSAKWKGRNIILKAKKRSSYNDWEEAFLDSLNQNLTELRESFMTVMYDHVLSQLVKYENEKENYLKKVISPSQLLSQLFFNASLVNLERKEMQSLWSLLQQNEFYILQILQNYKHIPRIYGTCWQFYAVEEVRTLDTFTGLLSMQTTWRTQVGIALDLLKLVHELNTETIYGSWQHCDIQPSNFGIAKNGVVKIIDVDLMFTSDKALEILKQDATVCTKDEDCEFFDCVSQCNVNTKTCSSNRISNNLQVVCRDLLKPKWVEGGLLASIPAKSKTKFNTILMECSAQSSNLWTKSKYDRIIKSLTVYLTDEMTNKDSETEQFDNID